jgi:DUF4097 and DUF4098 domain-containing protein YvlB
MKTITTLSIMLAAACGLKAQQHTETVKKELKFEKPSASNVLYIANINGDIEVEGYDGATIQIEAYKKIVAKSDSRLEEGKQAVQVSVIDLMDTLIVYGSQPCCPFTQAFDRSKERGGWDYHWSRQSDGCRENFKYKIDYKVKVPRNTSLMVSTINDGNINVMNVSGEVKAWNVNGSITLNKVADATYANTINGDVTLNFTNNPKKDGRYYSLNGDINANYLSGLSADMSFKSFNGEFYTNVQSLEQMPNQLKMEKASKGKGIAYKLDGKTMMRVRNGGIYLDFETFNGDVYVKEN